MPAGINSAFEEGSITAKGMVFVCGIKAPCVMAAEGNRVGEFRTPIEVFIT